MISTIIFDLSEVYLGGMYRIEEKIARIIGKDVPLDYIYLSQEAEDFFHGKISEEDFWQRLIRANDWNISVSTLKELVRSQMVEIAGTRPVIEALKGHSYKLGILSVHAREWVTYCESKYDYHRLFQSVSYSYEVGVSKPDPRSYQYILANLQSPAEEALFIDDSETNIVAAKNLGLTTILFKNADQLKADLLALEISV